MLINVSELTRFYPKKRVRKEKKLIGGSDEDESAEAEVEDLPPHTIVAHWSNNLTLTLVADDTPIDLNSLSGPTKPYIMPVRPETPEAAPSQMYPILYPSDFWLLRENMFPINDTVKTVSLHVNYHAISNMKFGIFSSMSASLEQQAQNPTSGAVDMDEVKRMLIETSPWLLASTAIVTVLHMLFEFLAFSSDIGHWRKKDKDLVGVSLNTILTNCFVQLVIMLYLRDSSEETSFMILLTQGM